MILKFVKGQQKRWNNSIVTRVVNIVLITSKVITRGIFIPTFSSGVVQPVGFALCGSTLLFSFATVITHKSFKEFTTKEEDQRPPLCLH